MNIYPDRENNAQMKKSRPIDLKKDFPALARELEGNFEEDRTWIPKVTDHLQRCSSEKEALEIINFFEQRGKISPGYARALRYQLVVKGLKSFGTRKAGEYESRGMFQE